MYATLRRLGSVAVVAGVLAAPAVAEAQAPRPKPAPAPVQVQLLALNDFHGNLEPPTGSSGLIGSPLVPAGGAAYLATHVRELAASNRNTLVVSAGDLIGASPLLSALFHDEPTIEAFNQIGLDFNAVGNHEFDEGLAELKRMQRGGCHPTDGCQDGDGFAGASFRFLAANVVDERTRLPIFAPFAIRTFGTIPVGFIGMTLEGTPDVTTASGVAGLDFLDEADTANFYARVLRLLGVKAIVVLLHEGGTQTGGIDDCTGISGPIADIVQRTTDDVDLFITGHTHQAYRCVIDGRPVTSASSFGRLITDIDLTLDRKTRDVASVQTDNVVITRDVTPAPDVAALVERYKTASAPIANRVVGSITADITRAQNAAGESALGNLIADAQLSFTATAAGAQMAFMNPGGIRTDLVFAPSGTELPGQVTFAEAFAVQPFSNLLVTMTLTGAQIDTMLEQQWCGQDPGVTRILGPSAGLAYTWSASAPVCDRVSNISLNGTPVDPAATYRVTVNSFLADGGDRFAVLRDGTDRVTAPGVDLDAVTAYLGANSPVAPPAQNRITRVG
jgi:5'-nucleotidase